MLLDPNFAGPSPQEPQEELNLLVQLASVENCPPKKLNQVVKVVLFSVFFGEVLIHFFVGKIATSWILALKRYLSGSTQFQGHCDWGSS